MASRMGSLLSLGGRRLPSLGGGGSLGGSCGLGRRRCLGSGRRRSRRDRSGPCRLGRMYSLGCRRSRGSILGLDLGILFLGLVVRHDLGLRFLYNDDLLLDHHNLLPLRRGIFLPPGGGSRRLALQRLRLLDEMNLLLGILGIIRHILPFTHPDRRRIQSLVPRRTRGRSSCPASQGIRNPDKYILLHRFRKLPLPGRFRCSLR